jgi:ferric-dicitrate binding protein FerR (iron transport regulator)
MTCDEAQALLSDALDDAEIDAARETDAAEHIDGCAACARTARELSSIHRLIVETNVADAARPATPSTKQRRRRLPRPAPRSSNFVPVLIAAGLLVGFAAWFFLRQPEPTVTPKSAPAVATKKALGTIDGRNFHDGDRAKGPATIVWLDGTKVTLADGAAVDRLEDSENGKLILFTRGSLAATVALQPAGKPLLFTTPHGEARVLGTVLRLKVDADPKKGTRLDVDQGKVELRDGGGRSALVEAGYYAATGDLVARKIETPGWKNITNDVGGAVWGNGGVTLFATVPGRDELLAGVGYAWLWSSVDGGESWKKLGDTGEPVQNMPHHLVFDPANPRTFWVSGIYGAGLHRTTDGGASFKRLGGDLLKHIDGLAVDFSDPLRRTLLVTKHLDAGGLQLSTDGGESWQEIGNRLPADASSSSMPFILDSKTFLVDGSGTAARNDGIYRSADAGKTWTRVSKTLSAGPPLAASDGTIYWMSKAGMGGLQKSTDKGLTWSMLPGPVHSTPVELPGGRLVGVYEQQLYLSKDGGASWEKFGEPIPIKPQRTFTGMTYEMAAYSDARKTLYVWRGSAGKVADAIFRRVVPE